MTVRAVLSELLSELLNNISGVNSSYLVMSQKSDRLNWYIVQQEDGTCAVVKYEEKPSSQSSANHWGGFASEQEAIAKKIGLIRSGKCKPQ